MVALGAFALSRLREPVLGGVTQPLLTSWSVALFLSHDGHLSRPTIVP